MRVVAGIDALAPDDGPAILVVGVFDGIHLGHQYLLRSLVVEAAARSAVPTVITFDHHPDEILTGHAPPLLIDPEERLERLAELGVGVTVVQHFDADLRSVPYDAFVERIRARVTVAGFLMTPDAAFGFERRGTPERLDELGVRDGFDIVVIPPFELDGSTVRSTDIRAAIGAGDLGTAGRLLGRSVTLTGDLADDRLTFALPMALPPPGPYQASMDERDLAVVIEADGVRLPSGSPSGRVTLALSDR